MSSCEKQQQQFLPIVTQINLSFEVADRCSSWLLDLLSDGSARLCLDFEKINAVTAQQPFYMPRVEEVLEGVGKARFISKMDLSKGYYQIKMH